MSAEAGGDGHSPNTQTKPAADHDHARFICPPSYTYWYGSCGGDYLIPDIMFASSGAEHEHPENSVNHQKTILLTALSACLGCGTSALGTAPTEAPYAAQDGDIIFQTSLSTQSTAIQIATGSAYSHVGIVYVEDGRPLVFEAVEPVKLTPLDEWIDRGKADHFVAKRLKKSAGGLGPEVLKKMKAVGTGFTGRHYDLKFDWSDKRLYCSELVWKIYKRGAGIELSPLETLGDFNLSNPIVKQKVGERWGDKIPLGEPVISPKGLFDSELLETVGGTPAP